MDLVKPIELNQSNNVPLNQLWLFLDYVDADNPYLAKRMKAKKIMLWKRDDH